MIYRGADYPIGIKVYDSVWDSTLKKYVKNTLQDIDAMPDLIIYIYTAKANRVIAKYRKVATSGFITLLRASATEYTAILPKSVTDTFDLSELLVEAEVQETDNRFPANIRRTKGDGDITKVKNSIIDE